MARNIREKTAGLHRMMAKFGWVDMILNHISVKNPEKNSFLMSPFGLLYEEVKASNLVELDSTWNILDNSNSKYVNTAGLKIHSAVYEKRDDVNCIIHTHTVNGITISALESELLLLDQMSLIFYDDIAYHQLEGIFVNDEEKNRLTTNLANKKALILKNHGLLVVGGSIEEAFWNYYYLEHACALYIRVLSTGQPVNVINEKIKQTVKMQHERFNKEDSKLVKSLSSNSILAFDAQLRLLEQSYKE